MLWIAGTGSSWRDLTAAFGHWHRTYGHYNNWSHKETGSKLFEAITDDPDLEHLLVNGSFVRVHQHGAEKKQQQEQAMSSLRGDLKTQIHAPVDAVDNPVRLLLVAGKTSEYTQAEALIEGVEASYMLAAII